MKKEQMITIGIVDDSKDRKTFRTLKEILFTSKYEIVYKNEKENIIILSKESVSIIIFDMECKTIKLIKCLGIKMDIVIHISLKKENLQSKELKEMFNRARYLIINSDEENWNMLLRENLKAIVITYGFNSKATINVSSYNIHDIIEANICFQRVIRTMDNRIIEAFELPIKIYSTEKHDIYPTIACIVCGVLIGLDVFAINNLMVYNMVI